jgi:hypothetical protein
MALLTPYEFFTGPSFNFHLQRGILLPIHQFLPALLKQLIKLLQMQTLKYKHGHCNPFLP